MTINEQINWLERCRVHSGELFNKRVAHVQREINKVDRFIDLKVNDNIQSYWMPVIQSWRERLAAIQS